MAMQKLEDVGESMEPITMWDSWEELEVPQTDLDFDLLPLGIDLRKLLIQATGQSDIENITAAKLKVVTMQAGLHRLAEFTPRLRVLTLDNSRVDSLRHLGSSLNCLENLSVCSCGLKSLDGIWGFRNLKVFLARDNMITDISLCAGVNKLTILDVAKNEIEEVSSFAFLKNCKRLRDLNVTENLFDNYRDVIIRLLPQIRILDGEEIRATSKFIDGQERAGNDSEPSKDKSSNLISDEGNRKAASMPVKKNDEESFSLKKNSDPQSHPRSRELDTGDEKYIVSKLSNDNEKIVQKKLPKNSSDGEKYDRDVSVEFLDGTQTS